ncbi:MAG: trigger factor [Proteobacteria bacterium]|nr:trigger factor [Pseudomonadota bacterium]MBU4286844.1 trigger factor [Pseudomonadota bacterium]MBU4415290.1 trigger factor [Pseudomonadota bacterium]MCG2757515.1 trigger factor [Desulfobacteraceae bacterium]
MQVIVEDLSAVKKVLHIEIPEKDVVSELDKAYKDLKKNAKVKGFRPGKTPRSVLERLYKKDVNADVSSKLIQDSLIDAIKETDLRIVGRPEIEPPIVDGNGPYKYDATVEIEPEIEDVDFKGLTLKKNLYKVSAEEINAQLKMLQKNLAQQKTLEEDRPAQEGDFVLIDYEGFKDGKPFAETQKTENFTLKIGDGPILKEFDEQLIGMRTGETREVKVHFPEDYFNNKVANLEITFNVKLNGIREVVLPAIDDEFAKDLGKYGTLEQLKEEIRNNLLKGYEKRSDQEVQEQIFTTLLEKTNFEVPDSLVEFELEGIIDEADKTLAYHGTSLEERGLTKEDLAEKYRDTAEKQVRRRLILKKIIEQENLTLSNEDLENGYKDMAKAFNRPLEEIKNFYEQKDSNIELLKISLLEKKALKLIIENSSQEIVEPELESKDTGT